MLHIRLVKAVTKNPVFSYYYECKVGEPNFDQTITRAELEAAGLWQSLVWPEGTTPPDAIQPSVEYTVVGTVTLNALAAALKNILGPRYRSALDLDQVLVQETEISLLKA